ncbi:hypothetical protein BHE97_16265 [Aeromicrobium sp. PE09-221]|uniref:acyl-CoA dehydrogenase family protein n=1 Tax=Aeromicrobium sp. PE09-221 TaxID=1898043 RepID=UPI000B3E887E|nr:acyl-CoA dehydrogenase family protein [Aeromicrobium sp. PE09-221]OUZ07651.1 hypothetical protein BHE97_16265 [Aeromicrobium sp. PE09-221]
MSGTTTEAGDLLAELRAAITAAMSRSDFVASAREDTDTGVVGSCWELARSLDLPAALVAEQHGGLGFGPAEAIVCLEECARSLAPICLPSHWGGLRLLEAAGEPDLDQLVADAAQLAFAPARPPVIAGEPWLQGAAGERAPLPKAARRNDGWSIDGTLRWVAGASRADALVLIALEGETPTAFRVSPGDPGVTLTSVVRFDHTTDLAHVRLGDAPATPLELAEDELARSWALHQAMLGAEGIGITRRCLEMSLAHARERYAFGRTIGSFQAIKHRLVEMLRLVEMTENCTTWFADAWNEDLDDTMLAGVAARVAGDRAQQHATSSNIFVHGGMGATWEHDAPYFYRRFQLRRLLALGTEEALVELGARVLDRSWETADV